MDSTQKARRALIRANKTIKLNRCEFLKRRIYAWKHAQLECNTDAEKRMSLRFAAKRLKELGYYSQGADYTLIELQLLRRMQLDDTDWELHVIQHAGLSWLNNVSYRDSQK